MATVRSFENFDFWQKARELSREIYNKTLEGSFSKDYSLKDQINRASGSIMDNIAEGFERGGNREFIQFLSYSKGSCGEVLSQLFRAKDRNHINEDEFKALSSKTKEIGKQIAGFMNFLSSSSVKGPKFINRSMS